MYLENRLGGDGNGFYCPTTNQLVRGTGVEPDDIAMMGASLGGAFHTRLATKGGVRSSLNHPFPLHGKEHGVLIHNGSWQEYDGWDISKDALSDTATAAELVSEHGLGCLLSDYFKGSGVWVHVPPGPQPFIRIVKRSGNIGMANLSDKALDKGVATGWMLVSERPKEGATTYTTFKDGCHYVSSEENEYGDLKGLEQITLTPDHTPTNKWGNVGKGWADEDWVGTSSRRHLNDDGYSLDDESYGNYFQNESYKGGHVGNCELCGKTDWVTYEKLPTARQNTYMIKRVCDECFTWNAEWAEEKGKHSYTLPIVD